MSRSVHPELSAPCERAHVVDTFQLFLHGNIDHEGNLSGRLNQGWNANNVTKLQAQVSPHLVKSCKHVLLRQQRRE